MVELLGVQLRLLAGHRLHEFTVSGGLPDELSQAWDQALQPHADGSTTVGLQDPRRHGVQLGLLRQGAGPSGGACRGGPENAHLGVPGPEGDQAHANWREQQKTA